MGRPFESELAELGGTYSFAAGLDVGPLRHMVYRSLDGPIIAVGSGGSYSAATFIQSLHQTATGIPSSAMTPLQAEALSRLVPSATSWLLSARGKNRDILSALHSIEALEPAFINVLCAAPESPLADAVVRMPFGFEYSFKPPGRKDGYLATNSLLASCVLLFRAYSPLTADTELPSSLEKLLGVDSLDDLRERLSFELQDVWAKRSILVLHDIHAELGALDLESKITESALGVLQFADFRNFAHGRHHWLTKYGDETAVIVLATQRSLKLAERTVQHFPKHIPVRMIFLANQGILAQLESLIWAYYLTSSLGRARAVDPGRPGIAPFGSKLYSLKAPSGWIRRAAGDAAIERKIAASGIYDVLSWRRLMGDALTKLSAAQFGAIIFDLDGTLLEVKHRVEPKASLPLRTELLRLLNTGVGIGVATGRRRNDTTRAVLRAIFPREYWSSIVVGFHNGSDIGILDNEGTEEKGLDPDLSSIDLALQTFFGAFDISLRTSASNHQLSVRYRNAGVPASMRALLTIAQHIAASRFPKLRVTCSTHSVDVIPVGPGKSELIPALKAEHDVLTIGDNPAWPGNDSDLLAHPFGLSVDRASPDSNGGWNFLPSGLRGVDGTVHYLRNLVPSGPAAVSFDRGFFDLE